ncbi:MAG TPA: hypothetical protein VGS08_03295 [Candidatus Saccharimonadales bacterium]|nr:hypothetical protein [Candidatus Saccharimonadales bacterium]
MKDNLRGSVLKAVGLINASKEDQDATLYRIEQVARKRFALALPELLTDKQLEHVDSMYKAGDEEVVVMQWIEGQIPQYEEAMSAIILDVAEEAAQD